MPARSAAPPARFPDPQVLARVLADPAALAPADLPHVQASGLSGALYFGLPEAHLLRPELRSDMLGLGLRHAAIRAELRPLLAAWAAEGIAALLFKGFALAEFEYAHPAERFYGDVDVLLPADPATVTRAVHLALARGWRSDGQHADPARWTHETAHLYSPGGHVRLDVHRQAISWRYISPRRAEQVTQGLWQRSVLRDWNGVPVRLLAPPDAAVVGVALARTWGGDLGGLKPADARDLERLSLRHGLSAPALAAHAAQLGGAATWAAFARLCGLHGGLGAGEAAGQGEPQRKRRTALELRPERTDPPLRAAAVRDGLRPAQRVWLERLGRLRRVWPLLPRALLDVGAAWWVVRAGGDPRAHLRRWTPARPPRRLPTPQLEDWVLAVSWWTRLLYPRQRRLGVCVPRAYATYRALRRAGHPAVFVSGVARRGGQLSGHAWVEDDRGDIEFYNEPNNRRVFRVLFRAPD